MRHFALRFGMQLDRAHVRTSQPWQTVPDRNYTPKVNRLCVRDDALDVGEHVEIVMGETLKHRCLPSGSHEHRSQVVTSSSGVSL